MPRASKLILKSFAPVRLKDGKFYKRTSLKNITGRMLIRLKRLVFNDLKHQEGKALTQKDTSLKVLIRD